jgi:predicted nucleic acid-binding protein
MRVAASDSSALIHLAAIVRLGLLCEFYDEVIVPPAVWREVVELGAQRTGVKEVRQAAAEGWLQIKSPTSTATLAFLRGQLDAGEAEAIALALEQSPEILLLDEEFGRSIARQFGLKITGTVGILIRAKLTGRIPSLRQELDQLRGPGRCYLSESLYQTALKETGE